MLVIFDGPEGSGKTSTIEKLMKAWDGPSERIHHVHGDSNPDRIEADFRMVERAPSVLWVYDRWWPSELVYRPHDLQPNTVPLNPWMLDCLYGERASKSGFLFLMTASTHWLERHRGEDSIDIDPAHEMLMYDMLCSPRWERVECMGFDYASIIWRLKQLQPTLRRPVETMLDEQWDIARNEALNPVVQDLKAEV